MENKEKEERFPAWLSTHDSELKAKCRRCGEWNDLSSELTDPDFKPTPDDSFSFTCVFCGNREQKVDRIYFKRKEMK